MTQVKEEIYITNDIYQCGNIVGEIAASVEDHEFVSYSV